MEGIVSHLRFTPSRPRHRPTCLAAALNTPQSYLLSTKPYASCTLQGVTPPSGPRLISSVYSALVQGWPSVGTVECDGSRFLWPDPTPPDSGAGVPARSPCCVSAPRTKLHLSTYALSGAFLVSFLWPWHRSPWDSTYFWEPDSSISVPAFSSGSDCCPGHPLFFAYDAPSFVHS